MCLENVHLFNIQLVSAFWGTYVEKNGFADRFLSDFLRPKRRATKFHEAWRKKCVEISYFRLFREENDDFSMFLSIWGGICSKLLSRAEKVQRGSNGKPIRPANQKTRKTEWEVQTKGSI